MLFARACAGLFRTGLALSECPHVFSFGGVGGFWQVRMAHDGASLRERHQLLTIILDVVYIDMKVSMSIVSVKAKPAFQAALE